MFTSRPVTPISVDVYKQTCHPNVCFTPMSAGHQQHDRLFDDEEFSSDMYQRPFRYLHQLETQGQLPQANAQGDAPAQKAECLATLLKYGLFSFPFSFFCVCSQGAFLSPKAGSVLFCAFCIFLV